MVTVANLAPYIWHYIHAWMVVHIPDLLSQSSKSLLSVANNCLHVSKYILLIPMNFYHKFMLLGF